MSIKFVPAWRRHPILLLLVVVGLIAVPAFEIWLLFKVADLIGVVPLVVFLVAEAMLGGWLMRREGTRA